MELVVKHTRKLLVGYDVSGAGAWKGDFLAPVFDQTTVFIGLRSRRIFTTGQMVFIGKVVTVSDIFSRLVDSGSKILDVEKTVTTVGHYLEELQHFKIGNVVEIVAIGASPGFKLVKLSELPQSKNINLP